MTDKARIALNAKGWQEARAHGQPNPYPHDSERALAWQSGIIDGHQTAAPARKRSHDQSAPAGEKRHNTILPSQRGRPSAHRALVRFTPNP